MKHKAQDEITCFLPLRHRIYLAKAPHLSRFLSICAVRSVTAKCTFPLVTERCCFHVVTARFLSLRKFMTFSSFKNAKYFILPSLFADFMRYFHDIFAFFHCKIFKCMIDLKNFHPKFATFFRMIFEFCVSFLKIGRNFYET